VAPVGAPAHALFHEACPLGVLDGALVESVALELDAVVIEVGKQGDGSDFSHRRIARPSARSMSARTRDGLPMRLGWLVSSAIFLSTPRYHRVQLECYGFNERAIKHAERAGFVKEGVKRSALLAPRKWSTASSSGSFARISSDETTGCHRRRRGQSQG